MTQKASLFGICSPARLFTRFGHALGLQHTLTSSVMSTSITRTTSKAKPLTADDIAGISLLYPSRTFLAIHGQHLRPGVCKAGKASISLRLSRSRRQGR